jgi:hypothetical protein
VSRAEAVERKKGREVARQRREGEMIASEGAAEVSLIRVDWWRFR